MDQPSRYQRVAALVAASDTVTETPRVSPRHESRRPLFSRATLQATWFEDMDVFQDAFRPASNRLGILWHDRHGVLVLWPRNAREVGLVEVRPRVAFEHLWRTAMQSSVPGVLAYGEVLSGAILWRAGAGAGYAIDLLDAVEEQLAWVLNSRRFFRPRRSPRLLNRARHVVRFLMGCFVAACLASVPGYFTSAHWATSLGWAGAALAGGVLLGASVLAAVAGDSQVLVSRP